MACVGFLFVIGYPATYLLNLITSQELLSWSIGSIFIKWHKWAAITSRYCFSKLVYLFLYWLLVSSPWWHVLVSDFPQKETSSHLILFTVDCLLILAMINLSVYYGYVDLFWINFYFYDFTCLQIYMRWELLWGELSCYYLIKLYHVRFGSRTLRFKIFQDEGIYESQLFTYSFS